MIGDCYVETSMPMKLYTCAHPECETLLLVKVNDQRSYRMMGCACDDRVRYCKEHQLSRVHDCRSHRPQISPTIRKKLPRKIRRMR